MFLIEDSAGRRPEIRGRIEMGNARIAGRLNIRNATIEAQAEIPKDSIYARQATLGAAIDAARLTVGAEVILTGRCEVSGRIDMSMGDMSSVFIGEDCLLRAPGRTAFDLTNAEIRAYLRLEKSVVIEGTVRLEGAAIHGTLALNGQLSQPEHLSLVSGGTMTVDGDVYLDGLRTEGGRVNFSGATLGSLVADGAQLHNPGGHSVNLNQAKVQGSVRLVDGFTSTGLVVLNRSTIEGRLQLTGGSFGCPAAAPGNEHGHAIEAISATVRGGIDLGWQAVAPSVDFTAFPRRRSGDLATELHHRRPDLRALREAAGRAAQADLGPGGPVRVTSRPTGGIGPPVLMSRPPGYPGSTGIPARPNTS